MHWFRADAPIRVKMMVVGVLFTALTLASGTVANLVGGSAGLIAALAFALAAAAVAAIIRKVI